MIFIIWRGWGWLVAVLPFALVIVFQLFVESIAGKGSFADYRWLWYVSFAISGVILFFLGNRWNSAATRTLVDQKTGEIIHFKYTHSFFWIPMEYWGIILPIIGMLM